MSCTAKIETQTKPSILTVPIMAVTRRTDQTKKTTTEDQTSEVGKKQAAGNDEDRSPTIVFVVDGKRAKAVPVKTGISDNSYVEVISGLTGGEEIIKGNYSAVSKDLEDKKLIKIDNTGGTGKPDEKKK
jgi:HlyD family secretion protein